MGVNNDPMPIEIRKVSTRRERKQFVCLAYRLFRDDPQWVPPLIKGEKETLDPRSNPAFEHCDTLFLLAFRDGEPAGRIAGIINHRYNEQWGKRDARFCWFDTVNDREVSGQLFSEVENWARAHGMERLVGPMGFTTFERQGILIEGFDEIPTFAGAYNPAYYAEHLKAMGYEKEIEYVEFELKVPREIPEKIVRLSELVRERYGLRLLEVSSVKEMLPYAHQVFHVINEAYKPLYGFTELNDRQITYFIKKYFSFLKPDYTTAVLDSQNRVIGFQISIPSLSKALQKARGKLFPLGWYHLIKAVKKPERIDMLLTGVLPEYQSKGVTALNMLHLTGAAIRNGIVYAESNNELEENYKVQSIWRHFEKRQHRRSRIFAKSL